MLSFLQFSDLTHVNAPCYFISINHIKEYDCREFESCKMGAAGVGLICAWLFCLGGEKNMYDVLIVGGGVIGCAIARELSRYRLNICLV